MAVVTFMDWTVFCGFLMNQSFSMVGVPLLLISWIEIWTICNVPRYFHQEPGQAGGVNSQIPRVVPWFDHKYCMILCHIFVWKKTVPSLQECFKNCWRRGRSLSSLLPSSPCISLSNSTLKSVLFSRIVSFVMMLLSFNNNLWKTFLVRFMVLQDLRATCAFSLGISSVRLGTWLILLHWLNSFSNFRCW